MFALFLFTFKGNIQCAKKVLRLAMEYADGDKCKIVYSSPEAMVEFSGEKKLKLSLSAICKIYIERSRYFFIRRKQNSPIISHAKLALCKECNQILLIYSWHRVTMLFLQPLAFPHRFLPNRECDSFA